MPENRPLQEKLDRLRRLHEEQSRLWGELDQSLQIQMLWPQAFDKGAVSTELSTYDLTRPFKVLFRIKRPDGDARVFPLPDVSDALLKPHLDQIAARGEGYEKDVVRLRQWIARRRAV